VEERDQEHLMANSAEERAAWDTIIKDRLNVVVFIADASALERNLYLVAELLALPVPLMVGLNTMDVAEQQGIHVEPHVLDSVLGLLEDVGYLTRAAYVMDRFMHPLELHGKGCLALCLGFACNVPAVLGARMVESTSTIGWSLTSGG
jgi:Fe2+ transport system protein B